MKAINVLAFPGTNCQQETARAIRQAGFLSRIFRWNDDPNEISQSDGLVIAGGFSFEDRGRSGVIAANDPVASVIRKMAAEGKPILGICNGAQVLVETGLVPGFHSGKIEMSLARNRRQNKEGILGSGFYHDFIHLKPGKKPCAWTNFSGVLRLPIAHGEGRFLASENIISAIEKNDQSSLLYCDANGSINPHFPVNPNGSLLNLAGVSNPQGNVMAMMPHPERVEGGQKIFRSLHEFFKSGIPKANPVIPEADPHPQMQNIKQYPIEIFVSLKITDNTEKTIESAAQNIFSDSDLSLVREDFWGIETDADPLEGAQKIAQSDEFYNENKEKALFRIGEKWFVSESKKLHSLPKSAFGTRKRKRRLLASIFWDFLKSRHETGGRIL
jgi:phosphoribosylformylglycinamidine synthase I